MCITEIIISATSTNDDKTVCIRKGKATHHMLGNFEATFPTSGNFWNFGKARFQLFSGPLFQTHIRIIACNDDAKFLIREALGTDLVLRLNAPHNPFPTCYCNISSLRIAFQKDDKSRM